MVGSAGRGLANALRLADDESDRSLNDSQPCTELEPIAAAANLPPSRLALGMLGRRTRRGVDAEGSGWPETAPCSSRNLATSECLARMARLAIYSHTYCSSEFASKGAAHATIASRELCGSSSPHISSLRIEKRNDDAA